MRTFSNRRCDNMLCSVQVGLIAQEQQRAKIDMERGLGKLTDLVNGISADRDKQSERISKGVDVSVGRLEKHLTELEARMLTAATLSPLRQKVDEVAEALAEVERSRKLRELEQQQASTNAQAEQTKFQTEHAAQLSTLGSSLSAR